jgi:drug/metabolite transporter (DMT)-like permease
MDSVIAERTMRGIVPRRLLVYGALLYVVTAWALNQIIVKQIIALVSPLTFTSLRFLCMVPLAFLLARLSGAKFHVDRRDIPILILCGACGYGIYQYLWIFGLNYTSPFAAALLMATAPIFTLVIVAVLGHEKVQATRWFGAGVALLGVAIFEGFFSGRLTVRLGDALALSSAVVFAAYGVIGSRLTSRYTPLELLAITMTIGAVMVVPPGVSTMLHTNFIALGWGFWWRFSYAVLFPIMLTYPVWTWGLNKVGAGKGSIVAFLLPVITGIASVPMLHARFEAYEIVGSFVCLSGMLFAITRGRRPAPATAAS